jgi:uncharacterized protein YecE (DUF72 family)
MRLYIGTSGWMYKDWNDNFYPKDLKSNDQLPYYAERFKTVEINSSFYRMPAATNAPRWYEVTPKDFVFTIKLGRYITHTKRLLIDELSDDYLREFIERMGPLKEKFAVLLVQLPPSLRCDLERFNGVIATIEKYRKKSKLNFKTAVEFRHKTWFDEPATFELLNNLDVSNVIIDSPGRWPANTQITGSLAYIRFHGGEVLYRSSYSDEKLQKWAEFIRTKAAGCSQAYAYFNNDYNAFAIANANTLTKICGEIFDKAKR